SPAIVAGGFAASPPLPRMIAAHNTTHAVTSNRYPKPRRTAMLQVWSVSGDGLRGTIRASVNGRYAPIPKQTRYAIQNRHLLIGRNAAALANPRKFFAATCAPTGNNNTGH